MRQNQKDSPEMDMAAIVDYLSRLSVEVLWVVAVGLVRACATCDDVIMRRCSKYDAR
jgi:hypothetical protein